MMQKRVFGVYFSMIRRRAIWAVDVIASASSRMMSLYVAREVDVEFVSSEVATGVKALKICFVEEKVLICSLESRVSMFQYAVEEKGRLTSRHQYRGRH